MSISDDLMLAVLAMDSYNRGYDPGLKVVGPQVGNASILEVGLPQGSEAASFFAQAYTLTNGQTIISFRGTDDPTDVLTGWVQARRAQ